MNPSTDKQLDALLQSLPRAHAPEGLAGDVVNRIDRTRRRRARWRHVAAAVAMAALGSSLWLTGASRTDRKSATVTAALRLELHQMADELERLERQNARMRPMVYLATADEVDIVIDLHRLAQHRLVHHRLVQHRMAHERTIASRPTTAPSEHTAIEHARNPPTPGGFNR